MTFPHDGRPWTSDTPNSTVSRDGSLGERHSGFGASVCTGGGAVTQGHMREAKFFIFFTIYLFFLRFAAYFCQNFFFYSYSTPELKYK